MIRKKNTHTHTKYTTQCPAHRRAMVSIIIASLYTAIDMLGGFK